MQKKDMIKDLAIKHNITQAESKRIFDAIFDELSGVLGRGDYFTEIGFGTFTVAHVKKRKGYNPTIQKLMMLPPKLKPKFKAGVTLKSKVNTNLDEATLQTTEIPDNEDESEDGDFGIVEDNVEVTDGKNQDTNIRKEDIISTNISAEDVNNDMVVKKPSEEGIVTQEEQVALMKEQNEKEEAGNE